MKRYCFDVQHTSKTHFGVISESEAAAKAEAEKRFSGVQDLVVKLREVKDLKWKVERCDQEQGAYFNDEYETINSNQEVLGPFDSAEEALNATRTVWGYCGTFHKSFDESYTSLDRQAGQLDKMYTVYAINVV